MKKHFFKLAAIITIASMLLVAIGTVSAFADKPACNPGQDPNCDPPGQVTEPPATEVSTDVPTVEPTDENGHPCNPSDPDGGDPDCEDHDNGSGNDDDCEDDNNGQGIPGHCKPTDEPTATDEPTQAPTNEETPDGECEEDCPAQPTDAPTKEETVVVTVINGATPTEEKEKEGRGKALCPLAGEWTIAFDGKVVHANSMNGPAKLYEANYPINLEGSAPNKRIVYYNCGVDIAWSLPGEKSEIFRLSFFGGQPWNLTRTPDLAEMDPAHRGYLSFTSVPESGKPNVATLSGSYNVIAEGAFAPAFSTDGSLTYSLVDTNTIFGFANATGEWHAFKPSGELYTQQGQGFTLYPDLPFNEQALSVAFRPGGGFAAIVGLDGQLYVQGLDKNGVPGGEKLPLGLSELTYVIWIQQ